VNCDRAICIECFNSDHLGHSLEKPLNSSILIDCIIFRD
jgi:hypothetical protein